MAGRELFVWYRVRHERAEEARAAIVEMQRSLRAEWPGLQARLLARDESETGTWMEAYSRSLPGTADDGGIDEAIEAAIAAAASSIEPLIEGARHAEAFALVA